MTTMSKPNGSSVQRARRHLAEARRAALHRLEDGRRQAKAAIDNHRRQWARRITEDSFVTEWPARLKRWALHKLADIVAWKIDRDTYRRDFEKLEAMRLGVDEWLRVMHGGRRLYQHIR